MYVNVVQKQLFMLGAAATSWESILYATFLIYVLGAAATPRPGAKVKLQLLLLI